MNDHYHANRTCRYSDLRTPTLAELLGNELLSRITEEPSCAEFD